jgi:hypothetical protein
MSSANPHDALFREVFSQPARLAGLLRAVLPAESIRWLDLDGLALDSERLHRHSPGRSTLPPIVPVVVHTGDRPWNAPLSLHELMPALEDMPQLSAYVPNLSLCLDDLRLVPDAELEARPVDPAAQVALAALKHARDRNVEPLLARWLSRLRAYDSGREPTLRDLPRLVNYLLYAQPHLEEHVMSWFEENGPEPVPGSIVDRWRKRDVAEGRAQGKAEGRAEGERALLLRQLRRRFGPLPEEVEARLGAAPLEDIERWADAFVDAETLAAVFR